MDPIAHLALATAAFLAAHYVSSTPLRKVVVGALGEQPYLGAYSAAAFITLGWMIWAYLHAPFLPLWQVQALKWLPLLVMPVALVLLACGLLSRNPSAVLQARALEAEEPARGVLRITRHPMMWAIALWALVHLLARGDAASLIFFGAFALLALSGTALIDARKADTLGEGWKRFAAATSNVPFLAIIQGRNRLRLGEIGRWKILAGLVLYAVLLALHPWLFGAKPY
ncbi:MAG: NnrU family protein [Betaproteobacteria bacterium]|nr:NnrU family protein [Betaproteobacteria bacterium]